MSASLRLVDNGHILAEQRQVSVRWRRQRTDTCQPGAAATNKPLEASTRLPAAPIDL